MALPVFVMEYSGARATLKGWAQPLHMPQGRIHEKQEKDRVHKKNWKLPGKVGTIGKHT